MIECKRVVLFRFRNRWDGSNIIIQAVITTSSPLAKWRKRGTDKGKQVINSVFRNKNKKHWTMSLTTNVFEENKQHLLH